MHETVWLKLTVVGPKLEREEACFMFGPHGIDYFCPVTDGQKVPSFGALVPNDFGAKTLIDGGRQRAYVAEDIDTILQALREIRG